VPVDPVAQEAEREALRRRRLRSMRAVATGLLVAMGGLFAVARWQHGQHPAWGYIEAFAEAAMIGALADWFAVVALFRHPLGVPLWHTAIIPRRKADIGQQLGAFVEAHFVTVEAVLQQLRRFEPARRIGGWLQRDGHDRDLGHAAAGLLRKVVGRVDDRRLKAALKGRLVEAAAQFDLVTPAWQLAAELAAERRQQAALDWAAVELQHWLDEDSALEVLQALVESSVDNRMVKMFSATIARSARDGLQSFAAHLLESPDHALRQRLDGAVAHWVERLRDDPAWHARLRQFQHGVVHSARFDQQLDHIWAGLRVALLDDLRSPDSRLAAYAADVVRTLGTRLQQDPAVGQWLTMALMRVARPLVEANRGKVARFIQRQIDQWSPEEMAERIELAVGRDLQFIRINGTLVGGLAGLLIHVCIQLF